MNVFSVNAFAATPNEHMMTDEEIMLLSDSSDMQLECPICHRMPNFEGSWSEWTYYYTYVWARYSCSICDITWNTCIAQIPNMTDDEEKEDRNIKEKENKAKGKMNKDEGIIE